MNCVNHKERLQRGPCPHSHLRMLAFLSDTCSGSVMSAKLWVIKSWRLGANWSLAPNLTVDQPLNTRAFIQSLISPFLFEEGVTVYCLASEWCSHHTGTIFNQHGSCGSDGLEQLTFSQRLKKHEKCELQQAVHLCHIYACHYFCNHLCCYF